MFVILNKRWGQWANCQINPYFPNAPFLYPLKTSENRKVFWCFQGVEKGCIGKIWVKVALVKVFIVPYGRNLKWKFYNLPYCTNLRHLFTWLTVPSLFNIRDKLITVATFQRNRCWVLNQKEWKLFSFSWSFLRLKKLYMFITLNMLFSFSWSFLRLKKLNMFITFNMLFSQIH